MNRLIATILAALFATGAQALTIEATLTDFDSYPATVNGVSGGGIGTFELQTDITGTIAEQVLDSEFLAMCLEEDEFVSVGVTYTFNFTTLADAPTSTPGGMGAENADWILDVLAYVGVESVEDMAATLNAAELSLIQGVIYEGASEMNATFDFDAGTTIITGVGGDIAGVTNAAQNDFVSDLLYEGWALQNVGISGGAAAFTTFTGQDFMVFTTTEVEEPDAAFLLGLGLVALGITAHRRQRGRKQ